MESVRSWGAEPEREPSIPAEAEPVFSECGRVIYPAGDERIRHGGVDYRSHWFRVARESHAGAYTLYVKHGAGEESFVLGYASAVKSTLDALAALDSDARYLALHLLYTIHKDARQSQREETARRYATAFVEGRLKKRRSRGRVTVEIRPSRSVAVAGGL